MTKLIETHWVISSFIFWFTGFFLTYVLLRWNERKHLKKRGEKYGWDEVCNNLLASSLSWLVLWIAILAVIRDQTSVFKLFRKTEPPKWL